MDEESAIAAAEKVDGPGILLLSLLNLVQADAIRIKIGYPISPDTRHAASIARYYRLVEINKDSFFDNMLHAMSVLGSSWAQFSFHRFVTGLLMRSGPGSN